MKYGLYNHFTLFSYILGIKRSGCEMWQNRFTLLPYSIYTVSYTHLDVYKRQDLNYRASKNKRLLVELTLIQCAQLTLPDADDVSGGRGPKTVSYTHLITIMSFYIIMETV